MSRFFIPLTTLALGLLLNLIGVLSFILSNSQVTSLIPAFFGGGFLILGGLSFNANIRKHVIHIALLLALILGLYCVFKVPSLLSEEYALRNAADAKDMLLVDDPATALKMFAFESTAIACIIYLFLGIRSFLHARRLRIDANKAAARADAEQV